MVVEFKAAGCTLLVGVDLCCHSFCHCLCGQTLFLLVGYYNTANASSDPWKLPSIEINHTDGLCNSTELPIRHTSSMDHCIYIYFTKKSALNSSISKNVIYVLYQGFWAFSEGSRLETLLAAPSLSICRGDTCWYCFYVQAPWESNWCLSAYILYSGSRLAYAVFMLPPSKNW